MGGTYIDFNPDTYMWQWFCDCWQVFYGKGFDMFEKAMYVKTLFTDPRRISLHDWDWVVETIEQEFKEDRVKAIKRIEKDRNMLYGHMIGEWAVFNNYIDD